MREIIQWEVPIKASWPRATELDNLRFSRAGLLLTLIEEDTKQKWTLEFGDVQAFRVTTEECSEIFPLPADGGFFEEKNSLWLRNIGSEQVPFLKDARHFIVFCYDDVIEVISGQYNVQIN